MTVIDRVVRLVTTVPVSWIFTSNDCLTLITFTKLKVLVFDNSRVRRLSISVINNGITLVVILVELFSLKSETAVF